MKFDIDVSGLNAGDVVEQSQCESVIGFTRKSDKYEYQFALMQLADHVQKLLWKEGKRFTVVSEDGSVRVLTHEQASQYNAARFDGAISKMHRCNRRLLAVDCGGFDDVTLHDHNQAIIKTASILSAIKTTRKPCKLEPHVNNMPKRVVLIGGGD